MNKEKKRCEGKVPVKEGLFPWPLPEQGPAYLIGSRCETCGRCFFPKRGLCPECGEMGKMTEIPLSRKGRLYTYTIVRQAPPGFRAPYATALVDLPEGIRLFAQLATSDPEEIQIDGPVELTFGRIAEDREGRGVISYLFRPVRQTPRGGTL